jgi:hypothetical protein
LNGLLRHSYQVQACGVSYRDLAAAYQTHKDGENDIRTMTLLLQRKLEQHIKLFAVIEDRGGIQWLETCEYADDSAFWQGIGQDSPYIRCLISAFKQVYCNLYLPPDYEG